MMSSYAGRELEIFAAATNWKSYWGGHVTRFLHGDVLEVGAGLGANTKTLVNRAIERWVCLEPDPGLATLLAESIPRIAFGERCEVREGTITVVRSSEEFDAILYLDVLEHIADDRSELRRAVDHLRVGGTLIVLAPAHGWVFSAFDDAIGHYRRYDKVSLREAVPAPLTSELVIYLDSVGILASLANRLFLKRALPKGWEIRLWDKVFVGGSRILDPLLRYSVGKSVLGVWRKNPGPRPGSSS
jgi:SAM-dependent methyltransferase